MTSVQKQFEITDSKISVDKIEGALLGAAIGDALGWPFERPYMRIDSNTKSKINETHISFQQWVRKSGGRYYKYKEEIAKGEYSDDTQLILSVARSLQQGENWVKCFCYQELPLWLLYERGGGGALKWSADKWMKGIPPWQFKGTNRKDKSRYFVAGGNGVAMRILPHIFLPDQNIKFLFRQVMTNGICTHGHPRALIGALLYAKALWLAHKKERTLIYGELIESLLETKKELSKIPESEMFFSDWWDAINEYHKGDYQNLWIDIVEETIRNLGICYEAMDKGALAIDRKILKEIGSFDKEKNGAGTIAAVASIYLASRYAADPVTGLLEISHAKGADTDTISSMLGGLLGTLLGSNWIKPEWEQLQDRQYISHIAYMMSKLPQQTEMNVEFKKDLWSQKHNENIINILQNGQKDNILLGPIGVANVEQSIEHIMLTKSSIAKSWKLKTDSGQTLFITKISKVKKEDKIKVEDFPRLKGSKLQMDPNLRMRIMVSNLSHLYPEQTLAKDTFINMEEILKILKEQKNNYGIENFFVKSQDEVYIKELMKQYPKIKLKGISEENMVYIIQLISKFIYDIS